MVNGAFSVRSDDPAGGFGAISPWVNDSLTLLLIVFAIHLAPAFTPPTWPVIAFYTLKSDVPLPVIIGTAALGAASGRWTLATLFRYFAHRLPVKLRGNLEAVHAGIDGRTHGKRIILGVFLLGSSSAPLFETAGLTGLRLAPLTAVYFLGRIPRYSMYALAADRLARTSLWDSFKEMLTSPVGIAVELLMIAAVTAIVRADWSRLLKP